MKSAADGHPNHLRTDGQPDEEPEFLEKRRYIENWRGNNKGKRMERGTGMKGLGPGVWEWGRGIKPRANLGGEGKSKITGFFIYLNG